MNQDRFLVYGELYREVRDSLARAVLSQNTDELIVSLEVTFKTCFEPFVVAWKLLLPFLVTN